MSRNWLNNDFRIFYRPDCYRKTEILTASESGDFTCCFYGHAACSLNPTTECGVSMTERKMLMILWLTYDAPTNCEDRPSTYLVILRKEF